MPFGIDHSGPFFDPWARIRERDKDDARSGVEHSDGLGKMPEAAPTFEIWHVGESRFNGRDGQPLLVACMRNTRTGKETPVLYSRAYGLDSLRHAHAARLIDRPEGWEPKVAVAALAENG